ncbi:helix-turn-helix domain-containing protein [Bacillus haynesii]|uniref:helix-turn-helix domain-containing protein n=1 Tax=Bacillus haynesii TaxID=1925021 RepID=UPI00227F1C09|nr:helix-turn-helix domain-containing protein [Bacillus haynesii]MCY8048436.1 helix-turn-helix domain-containing protein [Bacillus haynesii]MCY8668774.1 helix-turn-helix domain-containing protein [Bacillus haynesii]MCY9324088.1 helix-turn-helix domain-containing protein [Bacillus haynesii]
MDSKMFSISFDKEMNKYTNEVESQVYLRVYTSMFTSGLVAEMGIQNFATLMAISSYMNEDGECFPTQRQLAERMGVHRNSVNRYINALLDFKINGKPVVTREIVSQKKGRVSSFYKIHPLSQIAIFNSGVEGLGTKEVQDEAQNNDTPQHQKEDLTITKEQEPINKKYETKDFLKIFMNKYREVYGVNFNPAWQRDMRIMKSLHERYDGETLEQILEIAVEEYDSRWKSPKFPRPTPGQVISFIADQVQEIIEERKKEDEQFEEFENHSEERVEKLNDKLSKLDRL